MLRLQPSFVFFISLIIIAVSCVFRFYGLETIPGVNGDEAWLGCQSMQFIHHEPVSFVTPSGKFLSPIFSGALTILHLVFPPSFALLRIIAAVSGVLALLLNFLFCHRAFDSKTALFSTLLLAVLPANIAFSRVGWEPSQILAASVIVVYSSLLVVREEKNARFWRIVGAASFVVAFTIHPMCAFLLPFPFLAIASRWRQTVLDTLLVRDRIKGIAFWIGVVAIAFGMWYFIGEFALSYLQHPSNSRSAVDFSIGVLQLFSGSSSLGYFPGAPESTVQTFDGFAGVLLCLLFIGEFMARRGKRPEATRDRTETILLAAFAGGLVLFCLLLGAAGLATGNLRYSLWIILPGTLLLTRAFVLIEHNFKRLSLVLQGAFLVVCAVSLLGFWNHYFRVFQTSGGKADATFQTAEVEPKLAALQLILEKQSPSRSLVITSSNWWAYWPMRYRSFGNSNLIMLYGNKRKTSPGVEAMQSALKSGDLWLVEFSESDELKTTRADLQRRKIRFEEYSTRAADGRAVVSILRPK